MRLFSVKEVNTKKQSQTSGLVRDSLFIQELVKKQTETYEQLKSKIDPAKEKLEKEFLAFTQEIQNKRGVMLKEITDLEDRREKALEPLDQKWYELEVKEAELKDKESDLKKIKIELEKDQEFLMEKSLFVEDKRGELAQREQKILKDETILKSQQKLIKPQLEELNGKWLDFHTQNKSLILRENESNKILALETLLNKKAKELEFKERDLDDREGIVGLKELNLDYKIERLTVGEKIIEKRDVWIKNKVASLRDREKQLIQRQIEHKRHDKIRS